MKFIMQNARFLKKRRNLRNAFDHMAGDYDRDFTYSETGKLQRKHVISYVEKNILNSGRLNILELNCGTGEDAICFHQAGNEVFATDISAEMIRVAKAKIGRPEISGITFTQLSFTELPQEWMKDKFDLVFSNFGGLNCINEMELQKLFIAVREMLKPGGRFVGVIMPKYCIWEIFYFSLKGRWKKVFRRKKKGPLTVMLQDTPVETWYYSPGQIKRMAGDWKIVAVRPIGFALPPSFLESFFRKRKKSLAMLNRVENIFEKIPFFARVSDHFLFDLVNKNPENE